jgi:effector-binding domain-containing protein
MYQVANRHLEAQPTLVMIGKVTSPEIPAFLGNVYRQVAETIGRSDVDFAGPPFARMRLIDETDASFEIEAGFPVDKPASGQGEVVASTLPGGTVAVVAHMGPYDKMIPAYRALQEWIVAQGGVPEGAPWEIYYSDPQAQPDPETWRTEIVQPYRPG